MDTKRSNREEIINYLEILESFQERNKNINSKLSLIDKKQQDILHCLELNRYNAIDLMKLVKCLIICRKTRRMLKDELMWTSPLLNLAGSINKRTQSLKDQIKSIDKKFQESNPVYIPKIVKDVFDVNEYILNMEEL